MAASTASTEPGPYTLQEFLRQNSAKTDTAKGFAKESERVLRIDVDGSIWLKPGSPIAYRGDFTFERMPVLQGHSIKEIALREVTPLARAVGKGRIYCAHRGYHIRIVDLAGEEIIINGESILAFEESLQSEMALIGHGVSAAAGGIFTVKFSGKGKVAFAVHGDPMTFPVTPNNPLITDPHATLAWSTGLTPELKTDLGWKALFRHGGGEPFQMLFQGNGFVVVQPSEDPGKWKPAKKLKSLVGL